MYPAVHAKATPDKPAYIMARSGQIVTYRELDDRSNQCAQLFRSLGLAPGDCIALCMENGIPIVVFDLNRTGNLRRIVLGEKIGTIIRAPSHAS